VDEKEAMDGFANIGMLTVAALLVVAEAVKKTGAIKPMEGLLGSGKKDKSGDTDQAASPPPMGLLLARFMLPVRY